MIELDNTTSSQFNLIPTGFDLFDKVVSGGLIKGGAVVLHASPGLGKSTLFTQVGLSLEDGGSKVMYLCGEETINQFKSKLKRFTNKKRLDNLYLTETTELPGLMGEVIKIKPDYLIVDSLSTLFSPGTTARSGSSWAMTFCIKQLIEFTKRHGITLLCIAQNNKHDTLAGQLEISHTADTLIEFKKLKGGNRLIKCYKNRFGTEQVVIGALGEGGLAEVDRKEKLITGTGITYGAFRDKKTGDVIVKKVTATVEFLQKPRQNRVSVDGINSSKIKKNAKVMEMIGLLSDLQFVTVFIDDEPVKARGNYLDLAIIMAIKSAIDGSSLGKKIYLCQSVDLYNNIEPLDDGYIKQELEQMYNFKVIDKLKSVEKI